MSIVCPFGLLNKENLFINDGINDDVTPGKSTEFACLFHLCLNL